MADPLATTPALTSATATAPLTNPVDAYKNPYTKDVLDSALKNMDDVATQRRNQLGTTAFQAGGFGDARHGVEDANITTGLARDEGALTASTNADAYDKGMGWLGQDIDRSIGTSEFNANLDNTYQANQLAEMGLGNSLQQNSLTQGQNYADALANLDVSDKGVTQANDNVKYQDWLDRQGYGDSQLAKLIASLSGTPGQATTNTTTTSPNNQWASLLASALSGMNGSSLFGNTNPNPTGL
jgi:hypothetical protein